MAAEKVTKLVFASATDAERRITWPCRISVPLDGGATEAQELSAEFTIPTPEELQEYQTAQTLFGKRKDLALLEKHLKGFPDMPGAAGKTVEELKEVLLRRPYVVDGLVSGLIDMSRGRAAKN